MKQKSIVIIILINICLTQTYRDIPDIVTKVGTSAMNWLNIDTDTRAIGMAGAQVAANKGLPSINYNPASLAFIIDTQLYCNYAKYFAGIPYGTMAYGTRLTPSDFVALHFFYMHSGPMEVTSASHPDGTGEQFEFRGMYFRGTYARIMMDRLKCGISLKWVSESLRHSHLTALAYDVGFNFQVTDEFILGISSTNLGDSIAVVQQTSLTDYDSVDGVINTIRSTFPLPTRFRLGLESTLPINEQNKLIFVVDVMNSNNDTLARNLGIEYVWNQRVFLRMGKADLGHNTFGIGIKIGDIYIDGANIFHPVLGTTTHISILFN